ncbi:Panacea domain-containing protein [Rhodohalobacter sp.]|uniref:Panacea domain-containing protein n=1 Tax=Rhodohalobacter sp. TaxID=1974210 RepID=UPI002ACF00E3|nr:Panacea domain-containing protein [Rhodohalobacter sp.]MDZ7754918.1 Panacea domain-containing protein [Rhodohalobacter sp.]
MGLGPNTYRNYENGDVPQLANAKLISLAANPDHFVELVNDCDSLKEAKKDKIIKKVQSVYSNEQKLFSWLFKYQEPNEFTGYKSPSIEKLSAMVAYMAFSTNVFKVKMNKLLFYADFHHFRKFGQSISGAAYQAIPMGPVPHRYGSLFEYGAENNAFSIELVKFPEREGERFVSSPDSEVFNSLSDSELNTVKWVKDSLASKKTEELIEISHEEEAWLSNKDEQSLIDYNFAFSLKHPGV